MAKYLFITIKTAADMDIATADHAATATVTDCGGGKEITKIFPLVYFQFPVWYHEEIEKNYNLFLTIQHIETEKKIKPSL